MKYGPHKNLYKNIHSRLVHENPKLETTPMYINRIKLWYIHTMKYHSAIKEMSY